MRDPQTAARLMSREELTSQAAAVLSRLRGKSPRVHCITNSVAQNFTANALLALGAVPSMTLSGEEIGAFVARSNPRKAPNATEGNALSLSQNARGASEEGERLSLSPSRRARFDLAQAQRHVAPSNKSSRRG